MSTKSTLILGIGNTLLSDEGAGVQMLDYLERHFPALPDVSYLDGGTLSFTLAPRIADAAGLIVIDAAELKAEPGTVEVFEGPAMDCFAGKSRRSVHDVSLGDLLSIARLTGTLPDRRMLLAIQYDNTGWGTNLSDPVKRAFPAAAERILGKLREWSASPSPGAETNAGLQTG